jgi:hypothetical protein
MTSQHRHILCLVLTAIVGASLAMPASAQPSNDDLATLRREMQELRAEVAALKKLVGAGAQPAPATDPGPAIAMLQEQVAEQAQTKVESKSRMPITLSGTIVSNTVYNSGEANWLENPNIVAASAGPEGSFSSTLKQTQLALSINGPELSGWQTNGFVQVDFLGGAPGFQTGTVMGLPRLLYAFARLERDTTAVVIGQDNMILAPRDPTSLASPGFPLLFRSGNLYLRAPQVRVEQRFGDGFDVRAGVVTPLAGDFGATYVFAPAAGAGERSQTPAVQARFGHRRAGDAGARWDVGVSGHFGRERRTSGTTREWAAAGDVSVDVGRIGFGGELYAGDAVGAFGGGLGQAIRSAGGFGEVRLRATERLAFNAGGGLDEVADRDRALVALGSNRTWFGNAIFSATPEIRTSLEYRHLETETSTGATRGNHHINFAFTYAF